MVMKRPPLIRLQAFLSMRIRHARTGSSKGASAVEWVIITAIIAGVALGLATVIKTAVESRQTEIVTKLNGE
jgi:Flp pilus assembly pilin Flp